MRQTERDICPVNDKHRVYDSAAKKIRPLLGRLTDDLVFVHVELPHGCAQTIRPGEVWPDDRGKHIQAHGGGVVKLVDTYYWFGEDRSQGLDRDKRYIGCYASKDLAHWTFRNQVVKFSDPENLGAGWVLERPKVFFNQTTKKYVMYAHLDDARYKLARVAVATCDTVDGDYHYLKSFRPLGQESRDIGQFIDDDGSAHLIFEDRPAKGFHIAKLSADYLNVERDVCLIRAPLEGGAVRALPRPLLRDRLGADGLASQPEQVCDGDRLGGALVGVQGHRPAGDKHLRIPIHHVIEGGGRENNHGGFSWATFGNRARSGTRVICGMPVTIGNGKLSLPTPKEWTLDAETGEAVIRN